MAAPGSMPEEGMPEGKAAVPCGLPSPFLFAARSEAIAGTEEHTRMLLLREPELVFIAAIGPDRLAEEVDRFERDRDAVGQIVADIRIQRSERREEYRTVPAAPVDAGEELVTPVVGDPDGEAVILVDAGDIGAVGQAHQGIDVAVRVGEDVDVDVAIDLGE